VCVAAVPSIVWRARLENDNSRSDNDTPVNVCVLWECIYLSVCPPIYVSIYLSARLSICQSSRVCGACPDNDAPAKVSVCACVRVHVCKHVCVYACVSMCAYMRV